MGHGKREMPRGQGRRTLPGRQGKRALSKRRGKRELPRQRHPLGTLLVLALTAGALAAGVFLARAAWQKSPEAPPPPETEHPAAGPEMPETAEPQGPRPFRISLLGDCTLSSSHYTNHFESVVGDRLDYPFAKVAEILRADDLILANLECSFSQRRLESSSQYAFCGRAQYAQSLALGGIEWVSMGNNHTNDFGSAGVTDTLAALDQAGVGGIGQGEGRCVELSREDGETLRLGIYVLPFNGSPEQMRQGAARLREEGADLVIACMHAGAEKIYVPTKRQTALAHAAIDGGADVVAGSHPHVLQPAEVYGGGVILYSLGNFCFGGNRNPGDKDTVIAQLTVEGTDGAWTWEMSYIPCSVSGRTDTNDYQPTPHAPGTAAYDRCLGKMEEPWDRTTAEQAAAAREAAERAALEAAGAPGPGELEPRA